MYPNQLDLRRTRDKRFGICSTLRRYSRELQVKVWRMSGRPQICARYFHSLIFIYWFICSWNCKRRYFRMVQPYSRSVYFCINQQFAAAARLYHANRFSNLKSIHCSTKCALFSHRHDSGSRKIDKSVCEIRACYSVGIGFAQHPLRSHFSFMKRPR